MIFLELFLSFIRVGAFSFGGGYSSLPLIKDEVMAIHNWMDLTEYADIITISQLTPGPVAINAATHVGVKMAGILGGVVATFSSVLPCFIIASIIAFFFFKYRNAKAIQAVMKGLRPAGVGLIATAGFSIAMLTFFAEGEASAANFDIAAAILFAVSLFVMRKWKLNPIIIILIMGGVGCAVYAIMDLIVK